MNQIETNKRLRIAAIDQAEAEKMRVIKRAEADSKSKYLQGVCLARQRKAIVDGLKE